MDLTKTVVIDYGASNTVAYVMKKEETLIQFNGEAELRSTLRYQSGRFMVGVPPSSAKGNAIVLHSTKLLLGMSYDEYLDSDLVNADFGCEVVCGMDNQPCFKLTDDLLLTSEDVAFHIIRHVCEKAMEILPGLSDVVLTIPGDYSLEQKECLKNAVVRAGFRCVLLMNEVAAATYYYLSTQHLSYSSYLVLDLGSHSTGYSIVRYSEAGIDVIETRRCAYLCGGSNNTRILSSILSYLDKLGYSAADFNADPRRLLQLLSLCDQMKIELSENKKISADVPLFSGDRHIAFSLLNTQLHDLWAADCSSLAQEVAFLTSTLQPQIRKQLGVLAVGGEVKSPAVKALLQESFQNRVVFPAALHCVAIGCLSYVSGLVNCKPLCSVVRRLPEDVGIGMDNMIVRRLLKRDTAIPCEATIDVEYVKCDNRIQTGVFTGLMNDDTCSVQECNFVEAVILPLSPLLKDSFLAVRMEIDVLGNTTLSVSNDDFQSTLCKRKLFSVLC